MFYLVHSVFMFTNGKPDIHTEIVAKCLGDFPLVEYLQEKYREALYDDTVAKINGEDNSWKEDDLRPFPVELNRALLVEVNINGKLQIDDYRIIYDKDVETIR